MEPFIAYGVLLASMSLLALICFGVDKYKSRREGKSRIPEMTLLSLATLGGAPGAILGMYLFRHKINPLTKFHFTVTVWLSLIIQIALGVLLFSST